MWLEVPFCFVFLLRYLPPGTGEGDVEDAEKLLQPYLKKYPKVGGNCVQF